MHDFFAKSIELTIDESSGIVKSLKIKDKERLVNACPLFAVRLRDKNGECTYIDSTKAKSVTTKKNAFYYKGFGRGLDELCVRVALDTTDDEILWHIEADSVPSEYAIEWIEFPKICLPRLIENCENGGKIVFPYNEGMIVTNENLLPRYEMEFPMSGSYFIFPNMLCSQFMAYLFDDIGLYIGAHDTKRGFKGIDFYPCGDGLALQIRLYSGADFGEGYKPKFPIIWKCCAPSWKDSCDIYRQWFEKNLPSNIVPISQNKSLPDWYKGSPLIVTYPVRGIHDYDKMDPNALFPYMNVMPIVEKIKGATGVQIMILLMHWEGSAPWAPPYMWPPFGGEEMFNEFRDTLHQGGDLLGVYCSGLGYTLKSKLIPEYDCTEKIKNENVLAGVCNSPAGKPELGITCTYQRIGYDICPASDRGREILAEGFAPIFTCGADYAQILDQNHGGGQYMCYARNHNHPPMPGEWMSTNMQELIADWQKSATNMILGCESAASEPFIGNLLMSDNRYELNYPFGQPIPVYAYLYHEYVRNFMGNQCGCPMEPTCDTLRYRLAYSFSLGDIMTVVLAPNGEFMSHWGTHDFSAPPDMEKTLQFIGNMKKFYENEAKKYLLCGKMVNAPDIECGEIEIPLFRGQKVSKLPRLLCTCWKSEGKRVAYVVINPEDAPVEFSIGDEKFTVPALDGIIIEK